MKKILMQVGVVLCFIGGDSCAVETAAQKVHELRALERYASCSQLREVERQVSEVKSSEGGGAERATYSRPVSWGICLAHFLPFILWQIAFLVSFVLLLFYRGARRGRLFLGFFCFLFAIVLFCGYFERSCEWKIISCRKDLHIGPGYGYPIYIPLPALEELIVLKRRVVDGRVWLFVKCRDREGWIEDDERACSS